MAKHFLINIFSLVILLTIPELSAFDGNRKGLYVGLGTGTGISLRKNSYRKIENTNDRDVKANVPFLLNYKMGYGLNEKIVLFLQYNNVLIKPFTNNFVSSNIGLGVNIYKKEVYPSLFFEIGLGYNPWYYLFNQDANDYFSAHGIGVNGGIGIHFTKIIGVGLNAYMALASKDKSIPHYVWDSGALIYDGQLEYTDIYRILSIQLELKIDIF